MSNRKRGTLYVGVTSDLIKRIWEHKSHAVEGFTQKYSLHSLVWYENHPCLEDALQTEKRLKRWNRAWKIELIEKNNSEWKDLYDNLLPI